MAGIRIDHTGITVADLEAATAFFVAVGLEVEGRARMAGDFVDTDIGIPGSVSDIVTLRSPGGGPGTELSSFVRPAGAEGSPAAMANEIGLRNVCFEVDDLDGVLERLRADGFGLVGGVGELEHAWRTACVRGPEGVVVALAERLARPAAGAGAPGRIDA